ncbi:hypothetical protein [Hymenobacter pini]|uniref:hypothetical protein n=1 Tax=Hymenobacter pini TaxID=2880879 RepID=UPI001CF44111|nr:hypothetical protein [Hymenobacter pini]MCA8832903.1 hypothetical protein [Hymenobacter pini]
MHRSFLLATGLSVLALSAAAQITKGTKLLGGNVGYNRTTSSTTTHDPAIPPSQQKLETKSRQFNVDPQVGLFIANNLAIGLSIGYYSGKSTNPYSLAQVSDLYLRISHSNSLQVAPYLRYYYMPIATFGIFGQLSASYGRGKYTSVVNTPEPIHERSRQENIYISVTPTMVYFPIDKIGLELSCGSIGYSRTTGRSTSSEPRYFGNAGTSSSFGASFGFNYLNLGASYYLSR